MSRYVIGVGLDCVLYDFDQAILQYLKDRWGILMRPSEMETRDLSCFTARPEVNQDLVSLVYPDRKKGDDITKSQEFFHNMQPMPYAVEAVRILSTLGPVVVITRRSIKVKAATTISIRTHFRDLITAVHYRDNPAPLVKRLQMTYFFEHNENRALGMARKSIVVYVVGSSKRVVSAYYRGVPNVLEGAKDLQQRLQSMAHLSWSPVA